MKKKSIGIMIGEETVSEKLLTEVIGRFKRFLKMEQNAKIKKIYCLKKDSRVKRVFKEDFTVVTVPNSSRLVKKCFTIIFIYDYNGKEKEVKDVIEKTKKEKRKVHIFSTTGYGKERKRE